MTTKRYGPPSPAAILAELLKKRGINIDPQRLEERVAAVRDRQKIEDREHVAKVRRLAAQVWKARRAVEVATMMVRQDSSPRHLAEARDALKAKSEAQDALREAVLHNKQVYADALRATQP